MLLQTFIENANFCSVPKTLKSIKTNINEIQTLIVVEILNGINKLAAMRSYWSNVLRFPSIVDAMPRNCYQTRTRFLHFVHNISNHDTHHYVTHH